MKNSGWLALALSYPVADYLVKLELDPSSLAESITRALKHLEGKKPARLTKPQEDVLCSRAIRTNFSCGFFTTCLTAKNNFFCRSLI